MGGSLVTSCHPDGFVMAVGDGINIESESFFGFLFFLTRKLFSSEDNADLS